MNKSILIFTILAIFAFQVIAQTEHNSTIESKKELPDPVFASIAIDTYAAPDAGDFCSIYTGTELKRSRVVVVVREYECKSKYKNGTEYFYEIMSSGNKLLIQKTAIELSENEKQNLKLVTEENRQDYTELARTLSLYARKRELEKTLKKIDKFKEKGIGIVEASIADVSEYTKGTSFSVEVLNPTPKTIKYIWFTVIGYNAVNDPVKDHLKGASTITVKAIGPINKDASGVYNWKYMWHTDIVETFKISHVKVQYMDGSIKTIIDPKNITMSEYARKIYQEN